MDGWLDGGFCVCMWETTMSVCVCACLVDTNSTSTIYPSLLFVVAAAADVCTCIHPLEQECTKATMFFKEKKNKKLLHI